MMKFSLIIVGVLLLSTCSIQAKKKEQDKKEEESFFEVKDSHIGDLHTKVLTNTETGVKFCS